MRDVALRLPRPGDQAALADLFGDPVTRFWNPGPEPGEVAAWIAGNAAFGADFRTWVVAAVEDDRAVGTASLFSIDRGQGTALVGYRTVPAERGRGVASAALQTVARAAFDELDLHRLQLYHAAANLASCAVARAAGFVVEGTLRESYRYGDGRRYDEHLHARLRTDTLPAAMVER
jgi:RimJ/RimL family protein N-acetyltransferase